MNSDSLIVPDSAVRLPLSATDKEVLALANRWVEALAREDYRVAYGMTAHERFGRWSPELINQVIADYGPSDVLFKVSNPNLAKGGESPRHEVERFENAPDSGPMGEVRFDLPLNGEWSDLTATFALHRLEDGLVLGLKEIRVL